MFVYAVNRPERETTIPLRIAQSNGHFNQIVYWSWLPRWKNQTLTPKSDAVYLMPFISTECVGPGCA
jgi:hypothetical protein